ncbi:hypothetical protein [Streptomyces sp. NBC_00209]|uniref:hypothetical protein n=1 Tax=Streptomyces sp. NBC_00209 TaxID=2975682 RepID=UPI0032565946
MLFRARAPLPQEVAQGGTNQQGKLVKAVTVNPGAGTRELPPTYRWRPTGAPAQR